MNETIDMDAMDLRILAQLQLDASLTNQQLAAQVHTSTATCLRRVKRLVDAGVILRTVALLAPERVGAGLTVIAEVTLDRQGVEHLEAFEARAVAQRQEKSGVHVFGFRDGAGTARPGGDSGLGR